MCQAPPEARPAGKEAEEKRDGASWSETAGLGKRVGMFNVAIVPWDLLCILLIVTSPMMAIYMYIINARFDGSALTFGRHLREHGVGALHDLWPHQSAEAWAYFLAFGLLEAALLLLVPGKRHVAPVTPKGNTPVYKANGVQCYLITIALFFAGWHFGVFNPARVYDIYGSILVGLNLFAFLFCWALYAKGVYAPSSSDHGSTGSILYDFYWGRELHPRLLGDRFDIKHWTNCRFGMMAWAVLVLCYAAKQYEMLGGHLSSSMLVSVILKEAYIFKFFLWEAGYLSSMDIAHDRAGYYTQWGCLVFVPAIYTSPVQYLVNHPVDMGGRNATLVLLLGLAAIYINYDIDRQRQAFRAAHGNIKVWGRPAEYITAKYTTASGEHRTSLLLSSGWWGIARHLHYLPELTAALCWSATGGFHHFVPFFYICFLTIILVDRTTRDECKCAAKYGRSWAEYCRRVPWKIVPGVW